MYDSGALSLTSDLCHANVQRTMVQLSSSRPISFNAITSRGRRPQPRFLDSAHSDVFSPRLIVEGEAQKDGHGLVRSLVRGLVRG